MLPNATVPSVSQPRVEVQRQVLRQQVRVAGTAFHLCYRSDRVPGRRSESTVHIPLTGKRLPRRVNSIVVDLEVAGVRLTETLPALPDRSYEFTWTGRDAAGDEVHGPQALTVRIGYVERAFYPRPKVTRWHEQVILVGPDDARRLGLGGWTLTPHHTLDPLRNRIYRGDGRRHRVTPVVHGSELHVPAGDGRQTFVFDQTGRHMKTVDVRSSVPPFRFEYDAAGRLASIEQSDGAVLRIERDASGTVTVVSPGGRRTVLSIGAEGYLTSIADPGGQLTRCAYAAGGLLRQLVDGNGNAHRFSYDGDGRIIRRDDPAGGFSSYASRRTDDSSSVAVLTALGRETIYQRERTPAGEQRSLTTCCGGRITETLVASDGSRTTTRPDGTIARVRMDGDAVVTEITTPDGLVQRVMTREAGDPQWHTTTREVNGRVYTIADDFQKRERVVRIGERVERVIRYDEHGRMIEKREAGLHPITWLHDDEGRTVTVRFGPEGEARTAMFALDADGMVGEVVDPMRRRFRSEYDPSGFLAQEILPDGAVVGFVSDAIGMRIALAPPGRRSYAFRRDPRSLIIGFGVPSTDGGSAETTYSYDAESRLTRVQHPDGTTIESHYDPTGQLAEIVEPRGGLRFTWDPRSGRRVALAGPDGTVVSHDWDGFLLRAIRWDGAVRGEVTRTHDPEFRVRAFSVNGVAIDRDYDAEGRLSVAGELEIRRDEAGRVAETLLGNVRTRQSFNGFGEVEAFVAAFVAASGDKELFAYRLRRDELGRVVQKVERIEGETRSYAFKYDARRRLSAVTRDGQPVARYEYDPNGNRVAVTSGEGTRQATFDVADRILRDGDVEYRHTANGERSNAGESRYVYDAFGNLVSAAMSDGKTVEYLLDGDGRRMARHVNGSAAGGFLYRDLITPIAELSADHEVVARFVFGERMNTPDYIIKGSARYRLIADPLGSPRLLVDAVTGAIAQRIDYDPFGIVERDTSPRFQPFGFGGGLYDPDTKLVHFGTREYDPATGRWTAPDPARFGGRDTNLYAYLSDDPVNLVDPFGLFGIFPGEGPNWHHTRNGYNLCPPTAPDRPNFDCPDEQGPPQLPPGWSYEGTPPTHGGHYRGFRHEAGYQCMYDQAGDLVTDPTMEGTYDYSPPYNPDGSVNPWGVPGHVFWDVIPWVLWGN